MLPEGFLLDEETAGLLEDDSAGLLEEEDDCGLLEEEEDCGFEEDEGLVEEDSSFSDEVTVDSLEEVGLLEEVAVEVLEEELPGFFEEELPGFLEEELFGFFEGVAVDELSISSPSLSGTGGLVISPEFSSDSVFWLPLPPAIPEMRESYSELFIK